LGQASLDASFVDYYQRRHFVDLEARCEVGMLANLHVVDDERAVIPPPLKYLGEVALDAPRGAVQLRVEKDKTRLRRVGLRGRVSAGCCRPARHLVPPSLDDLAEPRRIYPLHPRI
jgi:hypothetical protein